MAPSDSQSTSLGRSASIYNSRTGEVYYVTFKGTEPRSNERQQLRDQL